MFFEIARAAPRCLCRGSTAGGFAVRWFGECQSAAGDIGNRQYRGRDSISPKRSVAVAGLQGDMLLCVIYQHSSKQQTAPSRDKTA